MATNAILYCGLTPTLAVSWTTSTGLGNSPNNTVFGITHKSAMAAGFGELASRIDLYRLVLETDSPLLSPHGLAFGHPIELLSQSQMIVEHRNLPSWVILRVAALNAQTFLPSVIASVADIINRPLCLCQVVGPRQQQLGAHSTSANIPYENIPW